MYVTHNVCNTPAQFSGSSFFSLDVILIAFKYLWFNLRFTPLTISTSLFSTVASEVEPLQPSITRMTLGSTGNWNRSPTLSNLNPALWKKERKVVASITVSDKKVHACSCRYFSNFKGWKIHCTTNDNVWRRATEGYCCKLRIAYNNYDYTCVSSHTGHKLNRYTILQCKVKLIKRLNLLRKEMSWLYTCIITFIAQHNSHKLYIYVYVVKASAINLKMFVSMIVTQEARRKWMPPYQCTS